MQDLFEKLKRELILSGLSSATQKSYLEHLKQLKRYYNKPLESLAQEKIKNYIYYLITKKKLSESTINQAYYACKFFFERVLKRDNFMVSIPKLKAAKRKLPNVLARQEVKSLITCLTNLKHKCILLTTYTGGLRVSETSHLRISDIDSKRMQIRVNQGKGKKDRYTLLSVINLKYLRKYYQLYKPYNWLFSGANPNKPVSVRTIQKVFEVAKQKARIRKPVSVHSLRHSFATHLIESGIGIHHVQKFLGHESIKTTTIYLHITRNKLFNMINPLDFPEL